MRLIVTHRFLATGGSFQDFKLSMSVSPQALGEVIIETCMAIQKALQNFIQQTLAVAELISLISQHNPLPISKTYHLQLPNTTWPLGRTVFGILVSRFTIFQKSINISPVKVNAIVLACCYLHNSLRIHSSSYINNQLPV
ncbi:hypothetical protein J437_LFUL017139 [Ladona fulva]|uniref:DDE Tnp4 domain-containing protein n=1 Tax=Ladona fulva TaxID=123851 RepID=A0A8K0P861_LADFU|nr:hypothetical protein J437_LFUL017139 [Ladona fulva]